MTPWIPLIAGLGLFSSCWIAQIVVWKFLRIKKPIRALGVVFIALPITLIFFSYVRFDFYWQELLLAGVLHLSVAAAFIQTYPAFQEDIPSFKLLMFIDKSPGRRIAEKELIEIMSTDDLLHSKVQDLANEGLARIDGDGLHLTKSGEMLVKIFSRYRKFIGLPSGAG